MGRGAHFITGNRHEELTAIVKEADIPFRRIALGDVAPPILLVHITHYRRIKLQTIQCKGQMQRRGLGGQLMTPADHLETSIEQRWVQQIAGQAGNGGGAAQLGQQLDQRLALIGLRQRRVPNLLNPAEGRAEENGCLVAISLIGGGRDEHCTARLQGAQ